MTDKEKELILTGDNYSLNTLRYNDMQELKEVIDNAGGGYYTRLLKALTMAYTLGYDRATRHAEYMRKKTRAKQ